MILINLSRERSLVQRKGGILKNAWDLLSCGCCILYVLCAAQTAVSATDGLYGQGVIIISLSSVNLRLGDKFIRLAELLILSHTLSSMNKRIFPFLVHCFLLMFCSPPLSEGLYNHINSPSGGRRHSCIPY